MSALSNLDREEFDRNVISGDLESNAPEYQEFIMWYEKAQKRELEYEFLHWFFYYRLEMYSVSEAAFAAANEWDL